MFIIWIRTVIAHVHTLGVCTCTCTCSTVSSVWLWELTVYCICITVHYSRDIQNCICFRYLLKINGNLSNFTINSEWCMWSWKICQGHTCQNLLKPLSRRNYISCLMTVPQSCGKLSNGITGDDDNKPSDGPSVFTDSELLGHSWNFINSNTFLCKYIVHVWSKHS